MNAIVLAGGLGTRLRSVVTTMPKVMAPVNDVPFLALVLNHLTEQGVRRIVLSVGYKKQQIMSYFQSSYQGALIQYVEDDPEHPLGTGGALKKSLKLFRSDEPVFVCNGDSFADVELTQMQRRFTADPCDILMAIKHTPNCDRYGQVELDGHQVTAFNEKSPNIGAGYINCGVYLLKAQLRKRMPQKSVFSFEQDFIQENMRHLIVQGFRFSARFIDIGVPDDYLRCHEIMGRT